MAKPWDRYSVRLDKQEINITRWRQRGDETMQVKSALSGLAVTDNINSLQGVLTK